MFRRAVTKQRLVARVSTVSRRSFNWEKLVTKKTDKATIAKLKALQQEVTSMRATAAQLSATVPPIDWAHWEKQLRTPGLVAKIRAEYESKKYAEPKAIDLNKFNAYWNKKIELAKEFARADEVDLQALQKKREQLVEDQRTKFWWSIEDYYKRHPEWREKVEAEFITTTTILGTEAQHQLEAMDPAEFRKAFAEGRALPWPEEIGAEVQALADQAAAKQAKVDETRRAREAEALKGIEIPAQSI